MSIIAITESNIEDVLNRHQIVILDFWAGWCEPCKVFSPIFQRIADKNQDLFFGKVNTETEHLLSEDFQIRSIPTLVVLKDKTIILTESGVIPEYILQDIVSKSRAVIVDELPREDDEYQDK